MGPVTEPEAVAEEPEASSFSPKDMALFALRATRENLWLCLLVSFLTIAIGVTVVSAIPDYYDATSKILIQDSGAATTIIASGRDYRPGDGGRGMQEYILARDNLLSIVREAKLFDSWASTRPWPMRLKDQLTQKLLGPPDRTFMERVFAEMLSSSIQASREGDSSVRIHAQWRSPKGAYDIARLVERNFLASRAAQDMGPIQRAIPFLEEQIDDADKEIESSVRQIQTATAGAAATAPAPAPAPAPAAGQPAPAAAKPDLRALELANLSRELSSVRKQQRTLTEFRRQKVGDLKMQLIEMKTLYSDDHPLVRQQEARIASMSEVPEELASLKEKEAQILGVLNSRGLMRSAVDPTGTAPGLLPGAPQTLTKDATELAPLYSRLGSALRKYEELSARLEGTRVELATAEADFKHRYVVVEPPEITNAPLKPKKKLTLFLVVGVVSLILGIAAGTLRELRRGRLVELWQVRALGVELLGEVNLK